MEQQPSDLEIIYIRYKYVGSSNPSKECKGKIAILPPEYRWLLDIHNNDFDGEGVSREWRDFDATILHYIDISMGDTLGELYRPNNPHGFYVLSHWYSNPTLSRLEYMAEKAMAEYYCGLTELLDPETM